MSIKEDFTKALSAFKRATASSMKYAKVCAELGIQHFWACGDVCYLRAFVEACPQNYVRRTAFLKWAIAHAPLRLEGGKLVKDKSETALVVTDEIMAAAMNTPFWDFAPETEIVEFEEDDVVVSMERAIARFRNTKKYLAGDERAMNTLLEAEQVVSEFKAAHHKNGRGNIASATA